MTIRFVFLLILTLVFLSCDQGTDNFTPVTEEKDNTLLLVIMNSKDELSRGITDNLMKSADYAKFRVKVIDVSLLLTGIEIPESVKEIVITTDQLSKLKDTNFRILVDFAARGGTILIAATSYETRLFYLMGLKPKPDMSLDNKTSGWVFKDNVFPGIDKIEYGKVIAPIHGGFSGRDFLPSTEIILKSLKEPSIPLLTRKKVGNGQVFYLNTSTMNDKVARGLLFSVVLRGLPGIPYPIANTSTIFLDDFPAPLYNTMMHPADKEYSKNHAHFVHDIWWPDTKAMADTFGLAYSAMMAMNYNANNNPPFPYSEWENGKIIENGTVENGSVNLARDVAGSRHELGFHGYNHFSFMQRDWPNPEFLAMAIQSVEKRWILDGLGVMPSTFVPPTNEADSASIPILARQMSSLKVFSSLYLGDLKEGGNREFDPEPYHPQFFDYPRITSGYLFEDESRYNQEGMYILTGIWTHFVHPDDVFQELQRDEDQFVSRNGEGLWWKNTPGNPKNLYGEFRKRIVDIKSRFPLIRFLPARDAAPIVKNWRNMKLAVQPMDSVNRFHILSENKEDFYGMFVTKDDTSQIFKKLREFAPGFHFEKHWDGFWVMMKTESKRFDLPELHKIHKVDPTAVLTAQNQASAEFKKYSQDFTVNSTWKDTRLADALNSLKKGKNDPNNTENIISLSVEFGQLQHALDLLRTKLLSLNGWIEKDAERYTTYTQWENKTDELWSLAEMRWAKFPTDSTLKLVDYFDSRSPQIDPVVRKRWLLRKLSVYPDSLALKSAYSAENQEEDSWPKTKAFLIELIANHPQSDSLYRYALQRSFWYDKPAESFSWFLSFPAHSHPQLIPLAEEIALLYAWSGNNKTLALAWAGKARNFEIVTYLDWLRESNRMAEYIKTADQYFTRHPDDDSLEYRVATHLLESGFYKQSLKRYQSIPSENVTQTQQLQYRQKLDQVYWKYLFPLKTDYASVFSEEKRSELREEELKINGVYAEAGLTWIGDNFKNEEWLWKSKVTWGDRRTFVHGIGADWISVKSVISTETIQDAYYRVSYQPTWILEESRKWLDMKGGIATNGAKIYPEVTLSFNRAKGDTLFYVLKTNFEPEYIQTAIRSNIYVADLEGYGELKVFSSHLLTGGSKLEWYTDNNWVSTLTSRYLFSPDTLVGLSWRPLLDAGWLNSGKIYASAQPYWTPDNWLIAGAGLRIERGWEYWSVFSEILMKSSNRQGAFLEASLRMGWEPFPRFAISAGTELSTSRLYRSNLVNLQANWLF
ncbi:MAG: DUF2194 domain-containing protein [Bacteroidetes bacterium]|nr:DUF2194 domain-containing protein [Bacteroidota bacterium]